MVSPTDETTLGELTRLESVSTEARELIGRLLAWAEAQNQSRGFDAEAQRLIREAIKGEDWNVLPTIERIEERNAIDASNSPAAKAREDAERAKEAEREETTRYGADAAKARQERWGFVKGNAEAEHGINRPENSDEETLVEVAS